MINVLNVFKLRVHQVLFCGLLLGLGFGLFVLSGCANTVTNRNAVSQIKIGLAFYAAMDFVRYDYVLIITTSNTSTLPFSSDMTYVSLPGHVYNTDNVPDDGLDVMYQRYSSWGDYILITGPTSAALFHGPFGGDGVTLNYTVHTQSYVSQPGWQYVLALGDSKSTLQLSFDPATLRSQGQFLYFSVLTLDKDWGYTPGTGGALDQVRAQKAFEFFKNNFYEQSYLINSNLSTKPGANLRFIGVQLY